MEQEYKKLKLDLEKNWAQFSSLMKRVLSEIRQDLSDHWLSAIRYNYSFCEFLYQAQQDVQYGKMEQEVYNILVRFLFKHPEIGYTKEYLKLLTFLMCFCNQQEAFFIFSNTIYYVIPPPLYPVEAMKNKMESVEQYIKYLIDEFLRQKVFEEKDILLVKQFLSGIYFAYYQSFFINFLPFQVCFSIIDNIIMKREVNYSISSHPNVLNYAPI